MHDPNWSIPTIRGPEGVELQLKPAIAVVHGNVRRVWLEPSEAERQDAPIGVEDDDEVQGQDQAVPPSE